MQNIAKACEIGERALQRAIGKLNECDMETRGRAKHMIIIL